MSKLPIESGAGEKGCDLIGWVCDDEECGSLNRVDGPARCWNCNLYHGSQGGHATKLYRIAAIVRGSAEESAPLAEWIDVGRSEGVLDRNFPWRWEQAINDASLIGMTRACLIYKMAVAEIEPGDTLDSLRAKLNRATGAAAPKPEKARSMRPTMGTATGLPPAAPAAAPCEHEYVIHDEVGRTLCRKCGRGQSVLDECVGGSAAAPDRRVAWLIERSQPENVDPPMWWNECGHYGGRWESDANRASKYPTKGHAEEIIFRNKDPLGRGAPFGHATEHVFMGAAAPDGERPARERTHWEGCWRDHSHAECARAEVERLRAALASPRIEGEREPEPETGFMVDGGWTETRREYAPTLQEAIDKFRAKHGRAPDGWEHIDGDECGAFVGVCEGCEKMIREEEPYGRDIDGDIIVCAACAKEDNALLN